MPIFTLIEQILRLINNLLEGVPVELRRAQAIVWGEVTVNLLPAKYRPAIQEALDSLKSAPPEK